MVGGRWLTHQTLLMRRPPSFPSNTVISRPLLARNLRGEYGIEDITKSALSAAVLTVNSGIVISRSEVGWFQHNDSNLLMNTWWSVTTGQAFQGPNPYSPRETTKPRHSNELGKSSTIYLPLLSLIRLTIHWCQCVDSSRLYFNLNQQHNLLNIFRVSVNDASITYSILSMFERMNTCATLLFRLSQSVSQ